jgi:hypothetical protein
MTQIKKIYKKDRHMVGVITIYTKFYDKLGVGAGAGGHL